MSSFDKKVVPMIHVPDVRATVEWYRDIGFNVDETFGNGRGGLSFAVLSFGQSKVMFNQGGHPSDSKRREVDLYVYVESVDDVYDSLKDRVEIIETPHDAFHGMREFIIRDCNRFWITFGRPTSCEVLMYGIREGSAETVGAALAVPADLGGLNPRMINAGLGMASSDQNQEIIAMLKEAGGIAPPEVDTTTLQSYVGKYQSNDGLEFEVALRDGSLIASPVGDPPIRLIAVDQTTFTPIGFDIGDVTFKVESGRVTGCTLRQGEHAMEFRRVA